MTIFYDGNCPMCVSEMTHLKRYDKDNQINLVDLNQPNFNRHHPDIDYDQAMATLHAKYNDTMLYGLDVTYRAWTLVGKKHWVAPLGCTLLRPFTQLGYKIFARNRKRISRFFWPQAECKTCQSPIDKDDLKRTDFKSNK
ncbi:thiol-disulfide oxidoreductase DCC family protein [Thalassotalea aquiviva]|uniref:thiol-disulfide oxidoreductase DCC family protein n=1 Tax=Thalassotalea aquiviva TaxID=3242415 RepID=UPI00352ABB36